MSLLSVVINADNRNGYLNDSSTVGDFGEGSLQGCRSVDFLLAGVGQKMDFFRGYDRQCILYIDIHEPIPENLFFDIAKLVHSYGNNSRVICKEHDRTKHKWNDWIYIEALKWAEGDYIAHFDNDANAIRTDDCDIVDRYFEWLRKDYKYICQPWDGIGNEMKHASTRFFICKKETLYFGEIEASLYSPLRGKHNPCLEFTLGILAGNGKVLYPPREDDKYTIFSWARYYKGTLEKLNSMKPEEALKHIFSLPFGGANDVLDEK